MAPATRSIPQVPLISPGGAAVGSQGCEPLGRAEHAESGALEGRQVWPQPPAGCQKDAFLGTQDAAEIIVESRLQIGADRGEPALGAEDEMVVEAGEGLRHGERPPGFLSPRRGYGDVVGLVQGF